MAALLIDGKAEAAAVRWRIAREVASLVHRRIKPGLAVIVVGNDPAAHLYSRSAVNRTKEVGMNGFVQHLPSSVSQIELLGVIRALNQNSSVHGIVVHRPLPHHIDADAVSRSIEPGKDVDGVHPLNAGLLAMGTGGIAPSTPLACFSLIQAVQPELDGLNAVVLGRSNIVGKPVGQLLLGANCTVTLAHHLSRDVPALARSADILVVAIGQPELVRSDWIKPGATVVDVGINRLPKWEAPVALVGDVAFHEASAVAGAITPVPGGVGPMTIACLLSNTLDAARARRA